MRKVRVELTDLKRRQLLRLLRLPVSPLPHRELLVRMRGFEPPKNNALDVARMPVPPHPHSFNS